MNCIVYKSSRKADTYLFVADEDALSTLPEALAGLLGRLERVMDIELVEGRTLASASAAEVMRQIDANGYYLQLPPSAGYPLDHRVVN